jgi:hypothetical protein
LEHVISEAFSIWCSLNQLLSTLNRFALGFLSRRDYGNSPGLRGFRATQGELQKGFSTPKWVVAEHEKASDRRNHFELKEFLI